MSRPLRAPREDGGLVVEPNLAEAFDLIRENQQQGRQADRPLLNWPLSALRSAARYAVLGQSRAYHRDNHEPIPAGDSHVIVMAGHQPELFHPGVWVKNFALAGLARRWNISAVNLIVDNDTLKSADLKLPALTTANQPWPHMASVSFDRTASEVPYEEATVRDHELFASLPGRVDAITAEWNFSPILPEFWRRAVAVPTALIGERFVRARRALERDWNCHNYEVPVSRLCDTDPFACFVCHLLSELPRFHHLYNDVVREYRRRHGIRSRHHPVPDLIADGDWREAPFWAWRTGDRRRGRLMVRRQVSGIELVVNGEAWPTIPLTSDTITTLAAWRDLERRHLKVRPRALTNTLFARLLLCDLFVHGIGGGLYDQLTDELMRGFYGVEPPSYMVLSATLLLPLLGHPVNAADERRLDHRLRDLHWNPQRHLDHQATLVREKNEWMKRQPIDRASRRQRFDRLRQFTEELRPQVSEAIDQTRVEYEECVQKVRANEILQRRDYGFCLYPESRLRPFCEQFLETAQSP